ncbi:hypothetical protein NEMBOFW57_006699 [Staphylotrichum longicolle]|uniref:Glucose receptor Git3 N-terminal domain-containing protein n=1 Tax=Staphylotrichum longicolle TaxID=669026 RepID=A0AAD4HUP0_9PEZI|nr:hypothetical protein NEMBOFW57_006699 [Staphylotrichum longicolle]
MLHIRGEAALNDEQRYILMIVTRVASALSALGVLTIIGTYCFSKHFRNPMHRLIVINAFYNALDVTCTMISTSGPDAGNSSALCQFQGFLNQMLEWKYMAVISITTFIPALVFLFINTPENGPMYGSVTLWCAIAPKWVLFRIVMYYVPIWSSIVITIGLYLLVGIEIARRRRILRAISSNVDSSAIEDTVPPPPHDSSCSNSTSADYDDTIPPSSDDSPTITSKYYTSSAPRINPTKTSSLSFRQYILMPLFFFLALLLVWVAPSTNRVASFINPSFSSYPLMLMVGITGSLRGFWNGIVFVAVGMRSWKRRKESDEMALRPVTRG